MKFKIIGILILAFIASQFVPYGKNHTNPKSIAEPKWDTPKTRATFIRLCGDCHSNETKWPIYSKVAPVSWLIQNDVDEGREHLNISEWGVQKRNQGDDAANEYEMGEMPPLMYSLPRPQNKLSQKEKDEFISGLRKTFEAK